MSGASN